MNVLVTGATGFLGTHLCAALETQGYTITHLNSKNANLIDPQSLMLFNRITYDRIFHLAAWTQAGDFCLYHSGEQWTINQQINTTVLTWWQQYQPQAKFISMGTSCAYDPSNPHSEENYLIGTPTESLFTYAMTKRMLQVGQLALQKQFDLKYLTLVPSTLYGAGYHTDGRQMHFIFDLIRKILRGKLYDDPVVLWGDGNQVRELIFVDDFISIATYLADHEENNIFNIGSGEHHTIREFADIICRIVDYAPSKIQYDTSRYVGEQSKYLVVDKLHNLDQTFTFTPLKIGLEKTIEWFKTNQDVLMDTTI